jgi:glycosyltransferase involved in cell wall biosynthesis
MTPPPPRVAFLSPRFADGPTVGGAETLLRRLAERTARAGSQVDFLTTCAVNHFTWANELPAGERKVGTLTVRYFPVDEQRDKHAFHQIQNRISQFADVSRDDELLWHRNNVNSSALYEFLRTEGHRYDRIIMGPYLFGLIYFAARIHPSRTVLLPCLHDECFAYLKTIRELFMGVSGLIFNTEAERDLAARLYGIDPAHAHVVGMGLDAFPTDPQDFRKRHKLDDTPFLIYCGRREPLKGTPILLDYLDVFRQRTARPVDLVLTGSGPFDPPPTLAPHIHDLGFVDEDEKHSAMAAATAFCHPSVNESLSIVILEAWLAGTPVLVHAGGTVMPDHCRRANGGLWFRNYPEFEEALMLLLTQPEVRTQLAKGGRQYVLNHYGWEQVDERLFAALASHPAATT